MLLAAKKKELELDTRVAVAFNYLSTALDARGSLFVLPAEICVMLGWGNTLKSVLCQLVTNDSMLDISERRHLYSKMVSSTVLGIENMTIAICMFISFFFSFFF